MRLLKNLPRDFRCCTTLINTIFWEIIMGIIDGKMVASQIKENITTEVQSLKKKTGKTPGLAVV